MTIVIAGQGFVGRAHFHIFKNLDLIAVDPLYNKNRISDVEHLEGVVCCVSTPEDVNGECDYSNIVDVLNQIPETVPVLIKSTLSLQGWSFIKNKFNNHLINFSPEFLRANTALEDIENLKYIIISNGAALEFWKSIYNQVYLDIDFYVCPVEEAIAVKYFENAFLATKLSFFNEIYDFCNAYNLDYEHVRKGMALDPRINEDHTVVDPALGYRGWGGHCFPKDTKALLKMAEEKNINLNILDTVVDYNSKIRKDIDRKV